MGTPSLRAQLAPHARAILDLILGEFLARHPLVDSIRWVQALDDDLACVGRVEFRGVRLGRYDADARHLQGLVPLAYLAAMDELADQLTLNADLLVAALGPEAAVTATRTGITAR